MPVPEDTENLELHTPGGWKARATGPNIMVVLVVLLCTATLALMMYQHDQILISAVAQRDKDTGVLLGLLIEAKEARDEQTYIMSLNEEQRAKLKLTMPNSLRQRIRDGSQ